MARRWSDPTAFRADPQAGPSVRPSSGQSVALLAVLVLVAGTIAAVSYLITPDRARAFDLLRGSVLIGDTFGPVNIDLPSGKPTLQLTGADTQVGIKASGTLAVIPLDNGTLLLNTQTGEFNMVDPTGFLAKRNGSGVIFGEQSSNTSATGIASGQNAFIERTGSSGTDVLLVSPVTVANAAASATAAGTAKESVKPRAAYQTTDQGSTTPGGAASANGALWALFKTAAGNRITELSLPANSSTGSALRASGHGTTGRVAAVESATLNTNGAGGDVVGVATPGQVRVFAPGRPTRTVSFPAPAGTDTILPTTNAQGRLSFLMHGTNGWSLVSVGTTSGRAGPISLGTIDPSATLATPAASLDSLYTMVRSGSGGAIYRIDRAGKVTAVTAGYPQQTTNGHSVESASFADAYLVARDSRVIVDSPGHYLALTIFTDGSRAPLVVSKSNVTQVNAANGPDALTQLPGSPTPTGKAAPPTQNTKTGPPPVSNKINCKDVNQKPHIPVITAITPSSRSVGLSWDYPRLANQDCVPVTYVLAFQLVSPNAPPAPGHVTIQDHTDAQISGLFPNTQYKVTVTAYINTQATSSQVQTFTTGKEGPAAPTALAVSTDRTGNWTVTWNGCGSIANKCVPADTWSVLASYCDGQETASPAPVSVPADPTSIKQAPYTLRGGDALLGRGLQFRVRGQGIDGTQGDPSAPSACVYSYGPPDTSAMTLNATTPTGPALGASTSTTVTLDLGANPIRNVGGVGSKVTLALSGNGSSQSKTFTISGAQPTVSATFTGVRAGPLYQASASIQTAHGGLSAQVPAKQVTVTSPWPATVAQGGGFGIGATCTPQPTQLSCELDVTFQGLTSAQADNERFRLINSSVQCRNVATPLQYDNFDPETAQVTMSLAQSSLFYGTCTVRVQLQEESSTDHALVFGGQPSPVLEKDVDLGSPTTLGAGSRDFSATWSGSAASVVYTGGNPLIGLLSRNWQETLVHDSTGTQCGSRGSEDSPPTAQSPHYVSVVPDCLDTYGGDASTWTVTITWDNAFGGGTNTATAHLTGPVPGYSPCNPAASDFTAMWTSDTQLAVSYTGDLSKVSGCPAQSWTFTLLDPNASACGGVGSANGASNPPDAVTLTVGGCTSTPSRGWSIRLAYTNPSGNAQPPFTFVPNNDPPA